MDKPKHKKMGTSYHNHEKVRDNIAALNDIRSIVLQWPASQSIIDEDQLRQKTVTENDNPDYSHALARVGTLYTRISRQPQFYGNKDAIDEVFLEVNW